ncbi:hypothetical protein FA95DRAFT_1575299 [Auriscalpium vulgare]|uniref:Uncharacterized protein n=1 Tax=Auriscalpium vulgare TaxID=40419 RepID=A0ACB8RG86_9AGAM|nr:hypothetical protein FA95DRAFT_1575299 [Auriscalpium vulgare]
MRTVEDITYVPPPRPEWMQEWYRNEPEEVGREHAKWLEAMSIEMAPMDDLPPELDATHDNELPLVHFGFIVSERRLLEYALEEDLLPADYKPKTYWRTFSYIIQHLRNHTRVRSVYLAKPWSGDTRTFVVSLYNNHTMHKQKFPDDFEEALLEVIAAELDIFDQPKWYWAIDG